MKSYKLTEATVVRLAEVNRQVLGTLPETGTGRRRAILGTADRCVILDAALAVATNSKTGATSGLATVCYWSTVDEEYTESDPVQQITVWNHSESTAHAIDTFGVARWINAHWWFFGDCDAMAAR